MVRLVVGSILHGGEPIELFILFLKKPQKTYVNLIVMNIFAMKFSLTHFVTKTCRGRSVINPGV